MENTIFEKNDKYKRPFYPTLNRLMDHINNLEFRLEKCEKYISKFIADEEEEIEKLNYERSKIFGDDDGKCYLILEEKKYYLDTKYILINSIEQKATNIIFKNILGTKYNTYIEFSENGIIKIISYDNLIKNYTSQFSNLIIS